MKKGGVCSTRRDSIGSLGQEHVPNEGQLSMTLTFVRAAQIGDTSDAGTAQNWCMGTRLNPTLCSKTNPRGTQKRLGQVEAVNATHRG